MAPEPPSTLRVPHSNGWIRFAAGTALLLCAPMSMSMPMPVLAAAGEARSAPASRVAEFAAAERMDGGHAPDRLSFRVGATDKSIHYRPGSGAPLVLHMIDRTSGTLRVRVPDGAVWRIDIHDGAVRVVDPARERPRIFFWHEPPGSTVADTLEPAGVPELEAIAFVHRHFLR